VGREMTVAQVMDEIRRDIAFYDESGGGVTFSGGEPLMQPGFLLALLQACKAEEIHTALDTCGYATWETLDGIRRSVDLFLYDLKLVDGARHREFTGASNGLIVSNLKALSQAGQEIILRVPVIPGVNDDDGSMRQIGALAAALPHLRQVDLLPYHHTAIDKYQRLGRAYALAGARPPSVERMGAIASVLQSFGLGVKIGG
jgi:pyruvate formate lyase activating enzyme